MNALKTAVKRVTNALGFELVRIGRGAASQRYEIVRPLATYSPWNEDAAFVAAYDAIRGHTLVDRYRCYELWQMVAQAAKVGAGGLLEVGVWRGGTGALIARRASLCGIAEPVFLCDTFRGVVKAGAEDSRYRGGEHGDTSEAQVRELLHGMKIDNARLLTGIFPDDTAGSIADRRFCFCHIDVDVYQSAKDILGWVWERMVSGGVVVFDDYGFNGCDGITKLVNEQLGAHGQVVVHNLNGHGIVIKL